MITGNATVCGVIGNPVGHSLSPLMHNRIARLMGLDYIYVPCPVEDGAVGDAVRGAYALGFAGLNVTVPYKQRVIPFLAEADESVRCIGACNTLVRNGCQDTDTQEKALSGDILRGHRDNEGYKGYKGYNTDAEGLFRAMREQGMEIRGRDCLLIGAGGAARAAAYLMVREGAASVTIVNRSPDRAQILAEDMRRMAAECGQKNPDSLRIRVLTPDQWRQLPGSSYLAVQTTSVGMYPRTDAAIIEETGFYGKISEAVDVIYTPSKTRFLSRVEAAGGRACGGLDMLLYQGIAALELWNPGVKVPGKVVEEVRRVMEEQLHERG